jgi:hypothetical protein
MKGNYKIKCPSCLVKYPLAKWKAEHKQGEFAKVACPSCGWQPEGEALVSFRVALATQDVVKNLRKREGANA